jgi:hypothetical protein
LLTIAAFLIVATIIALVMRVTPAEDEANSLAAGDAAPRA